MKLFDLKNGLFIPALLASGGALSGLGEREWRGTEHPSVPSLEERAQARDALDHLIASLSRVDAAYTSGNTVAAQASLEEATFSWDKVSPANLGTRSSRAETVVELSGRQIEERRACRGGQFHHLRYPGGAKRRHRRRVKVGGSPS